MVKTRGTGEFTDGVTASGTIVAPTGNFSDSLTVSEVPVATGVEFVIGSYTYVGNPFAPRVVELTGINRAHYIYSFKDNSALASRPWLWMPDGETGFIVRRNTQGAGGDIEAQLDAPPPGVSQTFTLDTFLFDVNQWLALHRLTVVGTPI